MELVAHDSAVRLTRSVWRSSSLRWAKLVPITRPEDARSKSHPQKVESTVAIETGADMDSLNIRHASYGYHRESGEGRFNGLCNTPGIAYYGKF